MPAPAPSRSTMKLTLTIGMIPLALDVFSAVEESSVSRTMQVKNGTVYNKVGLNKYNTVTGSTVAESDVVKCIETPEGVLVEVSDEEMQAILAAENGACEFIGFLDIDEFHYSTEKPYQVRAQRVKTKVNPYEKPFALIMEAMKATNTVALLSFVARGKTKYAALGSDGVLVTLRFDEEVRAERPMPEVALSQPELAMGEKFIEMFKVPEAPVFTDVDSARIIQFAIDKAAALAEGTEVVIPVADDTTPEAGGDLMALLAASIQK